MVDLWLDAAPVICSSAMALSPARQQIRHERAHGVRASLPADVPRLHELAVGSRRHRTQRREARELQSRTVRLSGQARPRLGLVEVAGEHDLAPVDEVRAALDSAIRAKRSITLDLRGLGSLL